MTMEQGVYAKSIEFLHRGSLCLLSPFSQRALEARKADAFDK